MKLKKSLLSALICFLTGCSAFAATFSHISMVSFKKNLSFILGEESQISVVKRDLQPFAINKYETTYGLWYQIRTRAESIGYHFENPGQPGSEGKRAAKPSEENLYQPVTMITWYDAIIWCNALSELKGRTPCYTYEGEVLRDSSDTAACDICVCDFSCDGYRLPCEAEWEYAARRTRKGFQAGDTVSGFEETESDSDEDWNLFSWNNSNCKQTQNVGTAGSLFDEGDSVQAGTGNANKAGLFDMSGNVLEFCWDWFAVYDKNKVYGPDFGYERVSRGGSWSAYTPFMYSGDRYSYDPNECYNYMGFRICCTVQTN